jgi:hypothetical protein
LRRDVALRESRRNVEIDLPGGLGSGELRPPQADEFLDSQVPLPGELVAQLS